MKEEEKVTEIEITRQNYCQKGFLKVGDLVKRKKNDIPGFITHIKRDGFEINENTIFKISRIGIRDGEIDLTMLDGREVSGRWDSYRFIKVNKLKEIEFEEYKKENGYV